MPNPNLKQLGKRGEATITQQLQTKQSRENHRHNEKHKLEDAKDHTTSKKTPPKQK